MLLKTIGNYSEAELSDAVCSSLDANARNDMQKYAKAIHASLLGSPTVKVPKKEKPGKEVEAMRKFFLLLSKIRKQLHQYQSSTLEDKWHIVFTIDINFVTTMRTLNNVKQHHQSLVRSGVALEKSKLLAFFERGRLYEYLKYGTHSHGNWKDIAHNLEVSPTTANRYIDFQRIIKVYPRLIICELSFEAIVSSGKRLLDYLQTDEDLARQLREQLRPTHVLEKLYAGNFLHSSGEVTELLSEQAN